MQAIEENKLKLSKAEQQVVLLLVGELNAAQAAAQARMMTVEGYLQKLAAARDLLPKKEGDQQWRINDAMDAFVPAQKPEESRVQIAHPGEAKVVEKQADATSRLKLVK